MINCVSVLKVHLRVSIEIWKDIRNPANGQYGGTFMEKYGYDIIHDAFLNKGTAFSAEERKKYHLEGLLPPCIDDIETQANRIYRQMERKNSGIEKRTFLLCIS